MDDRNTRGMPLRRIRSQLKRIQIAIFRWFRSHRGSTHQLSHATQEDRYPGIFEAIVALSPKPDPRVLSYGCSTGEEPAAIARYLPDATIVGADISEEVLRKARARCAQNPNVSFVNGVKGLDNTGSFEIVFAMSVLCRHPDTESLSNASRIYPFKKFDATVNELACLLNDGGLMVIYNANYRFADASISRQFEPVSLPGFAESGFVIKFDPDGKRSPRQDYAQIIFRKLGESWPEVG